MRLPRPPWPYTPSCWPTSLLCTQGGPTSGAAAAPQAAYQGTSLLIDNAWPQACLNSKGELDPVALLFQQDPWPTAQDVREDGCITGEWTIATAVQPPSSNVYADEAVQPPSPSVHAEEGSERHWEPLVACQGAPGQHSEQLAEYQASKVLPGQQSVQETAPGMTEVVTPVCAHSQAQLEDTDSPFVGKGRCKSWQTPSQWQQQCQHPPAASRRVSKRLYQNVWPTAQLSAQPEIQETAGGRHSDSLEVSKAAAAHPGSMPSLLTTADTFITTYDSHSPTGMFAGSSGGVGGGGVGGSGGGGSGGGAVSQAMPWDTGSFTTLSRAAWDSEFRLKWNELHDLSAKRHVGSLEPASKTPGYAAMGASNNSSSFKGTANAVVPMSAFLIAAAEGFGGDSTHSQHENANDALAPEQQMAVTAGSKHDECLSPPAATAAAAQGAAWQSSALDKTIAAASDSTATAYRTCSSCITDDSRSCSDLQPSRVSSSNGAFASLHRSCSASMSRAFSNTINSIMSLAAARASSSGSATSPRIANLTADTTHQLAFWETAEPQNKTCMQGVTASSSASVLAFGRFASTGGTVQLSPIQSRSDSNTEVLLDNHVGASSARPLEHADITMAMAVSLLHSQQGEDDCRCERQTGNGRMVDAIAAVLESAKTAPVQSTAIGPAGLSRCMTDFEVWSRQVVEAAVSTVDMQPGDADPHHKGGVKAPAMPAAQSNSQLAVTTSLDTMPIPDADVTTWARQSEEWLRTSQDGSSTACTGPHAIDKWLPPFMPRSCSGPLPNCASKAASNQAVATRLTRSAHPSHHGVETDIVALCTGNLSWWARAKLSASMNGAFCCGLMSGDGNAADHESVSEPCIALSLQQNPIHQSIHVLPTGQVGATGTAAAHSSVNSMGSTVQKQSVQMKCQRSYSLAGSSSDLKCEQATKSASAVETLHACNLRRTGTATTSDSGTYWQYNYNQPDLSSVPLPSASSPQKWRTTAGMGVNTAAAAACDAAAGGDGCHSPAAGAFSGSNAAAAGLKMPSGPHNSSHATMVAAAGVDASTAYCGVSNMHVSSIPAWHSRAPGNAEDGVHLDSMEGMYSEASR